MLIQILITAACGFLGIFTLGEAIKNASKYDDTDNIRSIRDLLFSILMVLIIMLVW